MKIRTCAGLAVTIMAGVASAQPTDSFHIMQIEQVIGSVNGDNTKQAIQLRMRGSFQNLLSFSRLIVRDATGGNPILLKDMTTDCTNFNAGDRVLIASSGFLTSTTPATVADFPLDNLIPPGYFSAGRLTFEDDFGTIYWSLSWGGAAYTGSTMGSFTNDSDGNFGPSYPTGLPSTGTSAMKFPGTFAAPSTTNAADYILTSGSTTWNNNARAGFNLAGGPAPCYPNCDQSSVAPVLNANDFQCFLNSFAANEAYSNCDGSSVAPILNANDFQCFLNAFAAGCR